MEHLLKARCEVTRSDDFFHVRIDAPGYTKENIGIFLLGGGQVKIDLEDSPAPTGERMYWSTRNRPTRISETFLFESDVDLSRMTATYVNGVLILAVPFKPTVTPSRIQVQ